MSNNLKTNKTKKLMCCFYLKIINSYALLTLLNCEGYLYLCAAEYKNDNFVEIFFFFLDKAYLHKLCNRCIEKFGSYVNSLILFSL